MDTLRTRFLATTKWLSLGGSPCKGDVPVARLLPTLDNTRQQRETRIYVYMYVCPEQDSNPCVQAIEERRCHSQTLPLRPATEISVQDDLCRLIIIAVAWLKPKFVAVGLITAYAEGTWNCWAGNRKVSEVKSV